MDDLVAVQAEFDGFLCVYRGLDHLGRLSLSNQIRQRAYRPADAQLQVQQKRQRLDVIVEVERGTNRSTMSDVETPAKSATRPPRLTMALMSHSTRLTSSFLETP